MGNLDQDVVASAIAAGVKASDLEVLVTATRMMVKLNWYGRVFDGPLSRRCKSSESWWVLESPDKASGPSKKDEKQKPSFQDLHIVLPKDDSQFWRALFEGGEAKSYYEVLQELVNADEPTPSYEDLPEDAKDLVDEIRER